MAQEWPVHTFACLLPTGRMAKTMFRSGRLPLRAVTGGLYQHMSRLFSVDYLPCLIEKQKIETVFSFSIWRPSVKRNLSCYCCRSWDRDSPSRCAGCRRGPSTRSSESMSGSTSGRRWIPHAERFICKVTAMAWFSFFRSRVRAPKVSCCSISVPSKDLLL